MVRKSGVNCKISHSENPKVRDTVNLDRYRESGCREICFLDFVKLLGQVVITYIERKNTSIVLDPVCEIGNSRECRGEGKSVCRCLIASSECIDDSLISSSKV